MEHEVLNYKSKPPRIEGSTTINHALRVKMGLGPMEYIFMDGLSWLVERKKPVTDVALYVRTGLVPKEQALALEHLVKKGYIYPEAAADGAPVLSPKWSEHLKSIEDEFIDFWTQDGKVCWPGSKPKAVLLYRQLRKKHSKEFLLTQRDEYFRYLDLVQQNGFNRAKMMATVFLGPQERFNEDWSGYAKQEEEKLARRKEEEDPPEPAQMNTNTSEDRRKLYEDTNE